MWRSRSNLHSKAIAHAGGPRREPHWSGPSRFVALRGARAGHTLEDGEVVRSGCYIRTKPSIPRTAIVSGIGAPYALLPHPTPDLPGGAF